ncbi:hypothetical protein D3C83_31360 [compost metagenome]
MDHAFDRVVRGEPPLELVPDEPIARLARNRKLHLRALHPALQHAGLAAGTGAAFEHLEFLRERELVGSRFPAHVELRLPRARHLRRHDPEEDVTLARVTHGLLGHDQRLLLVRKPVAHVVVVRHDPRAGPERKQLGAQALVHLR